MLLSTINICFGEDFTRSDPDSFVQNITWYGQSAIKIKTIDKIIYIDPFRIQGRDSADIILITHDHKDHFDPISIAKISTCETVVIAPVSCKISIEKTGVKNLVLMAPREKREVMGLTIESVPAYNIKKTRFHPKKNNWLGYIITIDGIRIYHVGDSERIPEMKKMQCDIAFVPLGQTYTMNSVDEAANAVLDVGASIAIPIHYGLYEGTGDDAIEFQKLLNEKVKVIILPAKSSE
jgi:L-ascorbate metabolism protein UlaG (beta-lactamase superfamily)